MRSSAPVDETPSIVSSGVVAFTTIPSSVTNKVYVIRNSTTGAFTVTVKISGQTGVTFSATDKGTKLLYANGTDFVDSNIGKLSNDYAPTLAANLSTNSKNIQIANTYGVIDENSNPQITFATTASATNGITLTNAATGNNPTISATGTDTNINLNLIPKGTGVVQQNGTPLALSTHKYHSFNVGTYYYDTYEQTNFLRLFTQNATTDTIRYGAITSPEYYDYGTSTTINPFILKGNLTNFYKKLNIKFDNFSQNTDLVKKGYHYSLLTKLNENN